MARPRNLTPTYRRHGATGQAVVRIGGLDHYLGPHDSPESRDRYDRIISEWLAAGRSPTFSIRGPLTVDEILVAFFLHAEAYYGESLKTSNANLKQAARPVSQLYGDTIANEFGPQQFKSVRQKIINDGRCRTGINRAMLRVIQIFRWAAGEGMIDANVAASLSMVAGLRKGKTEAVEKPPVKPVAANVVAATLVKLGQTVGDMVRVQNLTGMRPQEICSLRPCDINRAGKVWRYEPASHKTEHRELDRIIFIGPRAQAILRPYLSREKNRPCFSPQESEVARKTAAHNARRTPLGQGNGPGTNRKPRPARTAGERYTTASYRRAIHRACDAAFPPPPEILGDLGKAKAWMSAHRWSPNQLRHAAGTAIRERHGIEASQVVLGHASADVTQIYAERNEKLAAKIMAEMG